MTKNIYIGDCFSITLKMGAKYNYAFVKEFFEDLCSDLQDTFELQFCEDTILSNSKKAIITLTTEHMKIFISIRRTPKYYYITPMILRKDNFILDKGFREKTLEDALEGVAEYMYDVLDSFLTYGVLPKNRLKKKSI